MIDMETESENSHKTTSSDIKIREKTPPDGGWGWFVCVTSLMANGTTIGILISFGIIYNFILKSPELFGEGSLLGFRTSWIGSLSISVLYITNIFSGISCNRLGIRQTGVFGAIIGASGMVISAFVTKLELLYLTYSVVVGIGAGCISTPSVVILGHYFKDRIGLVCGIVACGAPIYSIILSIVLPRLLETVNLRATFLVLAGLYFIMALGAMTWIPLFSTVENTPKSKDKASNSCCKVLKDDTFMNKMFLIWILCTILVICCTTVFEVHIVKHAQILFSAADEYLLFTVTEIASGVSRPIIGKISDFQCMNRLHMHQATFFIHGALLIGLPFVTNYNGLVAVSTLCGVCNGATFALIPSILLDIVGPFSVGTGIGMLFGPAAIPVTVGPPVAGFLYDTLGTYTVAFVCAGSVCILSSLLMCLVRPTKKEYEFNMEFNKDPNPTQPSDDRSKQGEETQKESIRERY